MVLGQTRPSSGLGCTDVISLRAVNYYSENARSLAAKYNSLNPESLHKSWSRLIPDDPGIALDVGAGSGRDANWLAEKGWDVVAVEPCKEFREQAQMNSHDNVIWLDDELPELKKLRTAGHRFNLIMLSAVWMHISENKRERAFRIISELLAPGGILVFTLRHGNSEQENLERGFFPVSSGELEEFGKERALAQVFCTGSEDHMDRSDVHWETLVFKLPDDGTGSLPLLRHIIVNDDKSATYKLGLLRALIHIAEGAPGMVTRRTDDTVEIPFGLVGLYWLKLYMPLVLQYKLIQIPSQNLVKQTGLGFARPQHFYQLNDRLSPFDLRIGATFNAENARVVIGAIKDACANIQKMPVNYITYPGRNDQVFHCEKESGRTNNVKYWQIDKESLGKFGVFKIPAEIWQCMGQYACWLEPVIVNEWVKLMQAYQTHYDDSVYYKALQWDEGRRDTQPARNRVQELQQKKQIHCVWTDKRLKNEHYEIDHCFPWSRWYNNDLWNLMPASVTANGQKSEKLPSASLMHNSRGRITDWWSVAYVNSDMKEQFLMQAEAALPLVSDGPSDLAVIFEAVMHQRARLKANQQLVEWDG